jgi:hypothetical protein
MRIRRKYYLVPLSLAELVFRERLYREFQVWITLKAETDGHLKITPAVVRQLANSLEISERTVSRTIENLKQRNWIGYNPKSGFSFIRGFNTLQKVEGIPGRLGVWFDIDLKKQSRGFIAGSIISKLVREQRKKAWQVRKGAQSKRGAIQPNRLPVFFPVSCSSLEQIYKVSTKVAWNAKNNAARGNFIEIKHINEKLPIDNLKNYLKGYPEHQGSLFKVKGNWYLRKPDQVKTNLSFKQRERARRNRQRALATGHRAGQPSLIPGTTWETPSAQSWSTQPDTGNHLGETIGTELLNPA